MQTTTTQLIAQANDAILHTYKRHTIILEKGDGVYVYDIDGKEYLDFGAGIAVCALGYGHAKLNNALKTQIDKILHTSNLYYNKPAIMAAHLLCKASTMARVFFTNSGTEAIEGALKCARKYAFLRDNHHRHNIIAFHGSFHGRTFGALSVTGNTSYQEAFKPLLNGISFAVFNDSESVKQLLNQDTCAIILETIQGEGGITPAHKDFLHEMRNLCNQYDILLILDEIQCGMGRSGKMFAWEHFGIQPDIFTSAKGLGCGVPVGAFGVNEKVANASLMPGDHGSTYGGNPFVCAGVQAIFEIFQQEGIVEHASAMGAYLATQLDCLVKEFSILTKRQGMGLLQGVWVQAPNDIDSKQQTGIAVATIVAKALEHGLLLLTAGGNSLRFAPPLIISKDEIDYMVATLRKTLHELGF